MYRSKNEILKKLNQVKFALLELKKFQNRYFVYNGLDKATGCYPIEVRLVSFLILGRSIFQYAYKEAEEDPVKLKKFEAYVEGDTIIDYFKCLRNLEIHSLTISVRGTISAYSPIEHFDPTTGIGLGKPIELMVESLAEIDTPKNETSEDVKIEYQIIGRLEKTTDTIKRLQKEEKFDLIEALTKGKEAIEIIEIDGVFNLFDLCQKYFEEIEAFVDFAAKEEMIT